MGFSKGSTRNATLVCLATNDKIRHTSSQLFILIDEVQNVCNNKRAVDAAHVHFSIDVDCNWAREGRHDFMAVLVDTILTILLHDPLVLWMLGVI